MVASPDFLSSGHTQLGEYGQLYLRILIVFFISQYTFTETFLNKTGAGVGGRVVVGVTSID